MAPRAVAIRQTYTYNVCMQNPVIKKDRMVRKQVFITAQQQRDLKAFAGRQGVAEADLIRAGIDMKLAEARNAAADDWRQRLGALVEGWRNDAELRRRPDLGDRVDAARKAERLRFSDRLRRNRRQIDDK